MTPPTVGQIYERDGERRRVTNITGLVVVFNDPADTEKPLGVVPHDGWKSWASRATMIHTPESQTAERKDA